MGHLSAPTDAVTIKGAPHALEAEQSVLGGLLLSNQAYDQISGLIAEHDFYTTDHRAIFRALTGLIVANAAADAVTVAEVLERCGDLERAGGLPYLVSLAQNTPSAANIARYAEIVRDRAELRRLLEATRQIEDRAYSRGGLSAREIIDYAQGLLLAVSEKSILKNAGPEHVSTAMSGALSHIDDLMARGQVSDVTGLPTGFAMLDKQTTGFQPGDLVILAARPSMGKTSMALNIVENAVVTHKKRVVFFSLEMINQQLAIRMLSSVSRLNQQRVRVGRLNQAEFERLHSVAMGLREAALYLDEEGTISTPEIRTRCRRIAREVGGLDLIVIDYLQLIQTRSGADNRANEVAEISRQLKGLAKELACPVVALSQLNRGLESRPNKRPIMSDLRDSGGIEQDADLILFLYRDEVYHEESPDQGIAEVIVAKHRNGPTGTVYVNFRGEFTRFEDRHPNDTVPSHQVRAERRSAPARRPDGRPSGIDM